MLENIKKITATFAVGVLLSSTAIAQDARKLTYSTFYGPKEFYEVSAIHFMKQLTETTGKKVTFETYYGGSLLKAMETLPGLSRGAVDFAVVSPILNPREFPLSSIVLPFITENPVASSAAFKELHDETPALQDEFRRKNLKLLWALSSGENTLWTNKPVKTLGDLKGARIRSIGSVADSLLTLGATPVGVPWVEALELMQRGGVEGVSATAFNQAAVAGTIDMATHVSNGGRMGVYTTIMWAMNLDVWKSLDQKTKDAIEKVSLDVPRNYFESFDAEVNKAVAAVKKSKLTYVHLDDAEVKRWQDIGRPAAHERWRKAAEGSGVDPQALLAKYRLLVAKHEAARPYVTGFDRLRAN